MGPTLRAKFNSILRLESPTEFARPQVEGASPESLGPTPRGRSRPPASPFRSAPATSPCTHDIKLVFGPLKARHFDSFGNWRGKICSSLSAALTTLGRHITARCITLITYADAAVVRRM